MSALFVRVGRHAWSAALGAWFLLILGIGAGLLARHLVALPAAEADRAGPAIAAMRTPAEQGCWLAVHVLYAECRCLQRIASHLVSTARPEAWSELVLWTGEAPPDPELQRHGFRVERTTREALALGGIESAPMLLALDPENHVRYAGGYTERKQGPVVEDRMLLERARAGAIPGLPVLGCAVSERLRVAMSSLPSVVP